MRRQHPPSERPKQRSAARFHRQEDENGSEPAVLPHRREEPSSVSEKMKLQRIKDSRHIQLLSSDEDSYLPENEDSEDDNRQGIGAIRVGVAICLLRRLWMARPTLWLKIRHHRGKTRGLLFWKQSVYMSQNWL
mmetsp:Transcript_10514/g.19250  ORF Transcript_10514/g.19250 Transcript_10514/m.19250 type:complete len:134 (-) Transcript_10514:2471-2872(-)